MPAGEWIESHIPARLDRLPWSRWHWLIVLALGATWILDGLEVTLAGSLGGILTHRETLGLTDAQVGASATVYLAGAVCGALLFGYGTDRLGRKKLFFITVSVYLVGHGVDGVFVEFRELCLLSRADRRRNWRRIRGHQFRDRRTHSGARAWPCRSDH